jgi:hypothetical protein
LEIFDDSSDSAAAGRAPFSLFRLFHADGEPDVNGDSACHLCPGSAFDIGCPPKGRCEWGCWSMLGFLAGIPALWLALRLGGQL